MKLNVGMSGHFKMVAVDELGNERFLAEFENLILDSGLNAMPIQQYGRDCRVGSGSSTPISSQTTLDNKIASTNTIQSDNYGAQATAPYYGWRRKTYRFGQGIAAGNLSEVGVGWDNTGNISTATALFSRSLIKDNNGNPITITVLANEFLDVTYELRLYPSLNDIVSTINVNGISTICTTRSAVVTNVLWGALLINQGFAQPYGAFSSSCYPSSSSLGAITAQPTGSQGGTTSFATWGVYSNGTYSLVLTIPSSLNDANVPGGIGCIATYTYLGAYQTSFNPPLPKDNTKSLTITMTFSWSRRNAP
ncbi:hypothetical protein [Aquirhabdus sp.]|uniref:hypothetical protein n=1 Tax=Aquirhabdus sp. TaxID=2824160 RepID=UPI00396CBB58